jgi:aminoglycoside phosphotransferase (APT) family kinase protein
MASIGPAEVDLGWFFALREMLAGPESTELPGFLPKSEAVAHYQAQLGRSVTDLGWYEVFALLRSTAILVRMQRLLVEQGQTDHWLVGFDPVPARLRDL